MSGSVRQERRIKQLEIENARLRERIANLISHAPHIGLVYVEHHVDGNMPLDDDARVIFRLAPDASPDLDLIVNVKGDEVWVRARDATISIEPHSSNVAILRAVRR